MSDTEFKLEAFLDALDVNLVIPVIGPNLCQVDIDSEGKTNYPLYTHMTEVITGKNSTSTTFPVACQQYIDQIDPEGGMIKLVHFLLEKFQEVRIAKENPLLKLVRIKKFKHFIAGTYDRFLLNTIEFIRDSKPQVLYYTPKNTNLNDNSLKIKLDLVFHIFGCLEVEEQSIYTALTQLSTMDTIFTFFKYFDDIKKSNQFIRNFSDKHFLFLGFESDDWTLHYFIWLLSNTFHKNENFKLILHKNFDKKDGSLLYHCIQLLKKRRKVEFFQTEIENGNMPFVNILFKNIKDDPSRKSWIIDTKDFAGAVFISYENSDIDIARKIKKTLQDEGIGVWIDEDKMKFGDQLYNKIVHAMDNCRVFLPLNSSNTKKKERLEGKQKFFLKEWNHALMRSTRGENIKIIPIVIENQKYLDDEFSNFTPFFLKQDNSNLDQLVTQIKEYLGIHHE